MIITRKVHLQEILESSVTYTSKDGKVTVVIARSELNDPIPPVFEHQLAQPVHRA